MILSGIAVEPRSLGWTLGKIKCVMLRVRVSCIIVVEDRNVHEFCIIKLLPRAVQNLKGSVSSGSTRLEFVHIIVRVIVCVKDDIIWVEGVSIVGMVIDIESQVHELLH